MTGLITSDCTTLPEKDYMKAKDTCHPCKGLITNVYIGSATTIGASCDAGWGLWTPDDQSFNEHVALIGKEQGSDRAEVRALVAALEKT
jgi:hypothetical protein